MSTQKNADDGMGCNDYLLAALVKLSSEFTDGARQGRLDQDAIGLQIHDKGMCVQFKDIRLRNGSIREGGSS